jgi:hypothetical protein
MSLRGGDSYDHLLLGQLSRKYDYVGADIAAIDVAYGRNGTKGVLMRNGFQTIGQMCLGKNLGSAITNYAFFGCAFRFPTMPSAGYWVPFAVYNIAASGNMKICALVGADGSLNVGYVIVNNFSSPVTILASSAPGLVVANAFYYIEMGVKVRTTNGECIVRLNGALPATPGYLSYVGNTNRSQGSNYHVDDSTEQFTHVRLCGGINQPGGGEYVHWDDFYWCDDVDDGLVPAENTFLGDVELGIIRPRAAGTSSQFTPTSGANYTNVDDTTPDDDTTIVSSLVVGNEDLYPFETIPSRTTTLFGLLHNFGVQKLGAGSRSYQCRSKPSGASSSTTGVAQNPPNGWTNQQVVNTVNPATGLRWTPAQVNAAEFGQRDSA